ncbi:hypothetical protein RJ639_009667 [Escallonia herrerae]|uniref:Protein FLX-like 2 n=1 Tax=Escallonia herrerae TaxID=1293975 RepID=A0AA89AS34_9ASTE|nr:hypothetical protein RJ639_009667 [Escallonia herrerae]
MGSKGRMPPPHLRRPLPGPGGVHPDPFASGMRPPHGAFAPFDMLPPPEVMEHKLAAQHVEMQKLANENQKLAATHGTLRQQLAATQHELQMLHSHVGALKSEKEQQKRGLMDKIAKLEADFQAAEHLKMEVQQARTEAQSLHSAREELVSQVQQLTQDLQRAHSDVQQIPELMSELQSFRQEYQHCRATYDYEKKLFQDHLESLQVMEQNYMNMAREVEKLQGELTTSANIDRSTGGPYGNTGGYSENDAAGHYSVGQISYDEAYADPQVRGPLPDGGGGSGIGGTPPNVGAQSGPAPARGGYEAPAGYDAHRGSSGLAYDAQRGPGGPVYDSQRGPGGPGYDPQRGTGGPGYDAQRVPAGLIYDAQRGPGGPVYDAQRGLGGPGYEIQRGAGGPSYDAQRGTGYDTLKGPVYDAQRGSGYDASYDGQRGPVYDAQRGAGYEPQVGQGYDGQRGIQFDAPKGAGYDSQSRGAGGTQGQGPPASNASFRSATPPTRAGSGFEAPSRGGNPTRR